MPLTIKPNQETHMTLLTVPQPYLLFVGLPRDLPYAKTALGLRDWAGDRCIGEYGVDGAGIGLSPMTPEAAVKVGARAMVVGVASPGGAIDEAWLPPLIEALDAGLDLVSGAHGRLDAIPVLKQAAARNGRALIDVRHQKTDPVVGTGKKRTGRRLLTVGTDCSLGKKYTAIALTNAFRERDIDADFRATGQTGILIAGSGLPIDATISDFLSGAAEQLSPDAVADHWDVIEGQGSIFHPAYSGVSLGLLHGSQPDVIILCHEAGRERMKGFDHYAVPDLEEARDLHLAFARRTNPAARCAGVSLNTAHLDDASAFAAMTTITSRLGLPCADPIRGGNRFSELVDACLQ